jgi:hypothetical protein
LFLRIVVDRYYNGRGVPAGRGGKEDGVGGVVSWGLGHGWARVCGARDLFHSA